MREKTEDGEELCTVEEMPKVCKNLTRKESPRSHKVPYDIYI